MAIDDNVNVVVIMEKLLEMRKHLEIGQIDLNENDVRSIVLKAREIFLSQPVLLSRSLSSYRSSTENLRRYSWSISPLSPSVMTFLCNNMLL
jgi:hypothetical protein